MKLLIITQKVNKEDPILGFFHRWIIEFAKHCESVIVICLEEGQHELPENIRVLSLGKEKGVSRSKYLRRFYSYIWKERKNYDAVFVHMNPIYIVLGGWVWKILGKRISLWYTHKNVDFKLRMAEKFADKIFTASKESFRLHSRKVNVVGHGVDVERFLEYKKTRDNIFRIISVGRITRIKNLETLIEAAHISRGKNYKFQYEIIGPIITPDDNFYFKELEKSIEDKDLSGYVKFSTAVSNDEIGYFYADNDLNINLTPTGGLDKVVLEGIILGSIPVVSNRTFESVFGPYSDRLIFEYRNCLDLAKKIEDIYFCQDREYIKDFLKKKVISDFDVKGVVKRIYLAIVDKKYEASR